MQYDDNAVACQTIVVSRFFPLRDDQVEYASNTIVVTDEDYRSSYCTDIQATTTTNNTIVPHKKRKKMALSGTSGVVNLDKGGDINVHQKNRIWDHLYGKDKFPSNRRTLCLLCQFNEVGYENNVPHYAHVAPRCGGGPNTVIWNRAPSCATCNTKVTHQLSMLDFLVREFPHRVVPVVEYLFEVYEQCEPEKAREFRGRDGVDEIVPDLYRFAVTVYGRDSVDLPVQGQFCSPIVFEKLTRYCSVRRQLHKVKLEIAELEKDEPVLARFCVELNGNVYKMETLYRVIERERKRLSQCKLIRDSLEREVKQSARWLDN